MRFCRLQKITIYKTVFIIFNSTSLFVIVSLFDRHYLSVLRLIDHYIEYSMIEHWRSKQKWCV